MTEDPQTPPSEQHHEGLLRLHPRWRGIVRFCLTVVATLVLGIAVEKVTEATAKNTVAARAQFAQLQRQALQAIAAVKPSTAFILFMDGVTFSPKSQAAMWHKAEERRVGHPIPMGSLGSDDPSRYRSNAERDTGVHLGYWAAPDQSEGFKQIMPTAPVVAFVDLVWHLVTGGEIIARIVVLGQLALGGTLMFLVLTWLAKRDIIDFGYWRLPIFAMGAVTLGSGLAYATGFVITTSQALLGGLGHVAGISVGLGTVGSCCAAFVHKSLELSLDKRLESVLEKV